MNKGENRLMLAWRAAASDVWFGESDVLLRLENDIEKKLIYLCVVVVISRPATTVYTKTSAATYWSENVRNACFPCCRLSLKNISANIFLVTDICGLEWLRKGSL